MPSHKLQAANGCLFLTFKHEQTLQHMFLQNTYYIFSFASHDRRRTISLVHKASNVSGISSRRLRSQHRRCVPDYAYSNTTNECACAGEGGETDLFKCYVREREGNKIRQGSRKQAQEKHMLFNEDA